MASRQHIVPPKVREAAVYSAGAALAFVTDFALLWVLVERAGIHYLVAATVSFLAGTVVVYWVSIRHAFKFRRMAHARTEFTVFAIIGSLGILLNLALMFLLVDRLGVHYLAAKVASASITFCTNFALRRWLLFSRPGHAGREPFSEVDRTS